MKKAQKQGVIDDLNLKLKTAKSAIITDYKGLTVAEITDLRNELRKSSTEFKVVKNTLAIRAAKGTAAEKLVEHMQGPTGLVLGYGDAVAPTKAIIDYAKKQAKLKIKVGVVEGQLVDADALKAISMLPSREGLLSQMAAGFQAPASQMVRLLNATVARLGYALTALQDKKSQA